MECQSSEQIQMTITFYSDVRVSPIIYRDAPNLKQKLISKSNDNNYFLEYPIEARNISRRSKLNTEVLSKLKQQKLLNSDVRLSLEIN